MEGPPGRIGLSRIIVIFSKGESGVDCHYIGLTPKDANARAFFGPRDGRALEQRNQFVQDLEVCAMPSPAHRLAEPTAQPYLVTARLPFLSTRLPDGRKWVPACWLLYGADQRAPPKFTAVPCAPSGYPRLVRVRLVRLRLVRPRLVRLRLMRLFKSGLPPTLCTL